MDHVLSSKKQCIKNTKRQCDMLRTMYSLTCGETIYSWCTMLSFILNICCTKHSLIENGVLTDTSNFPRILLRPKKKKNQNQQKQNKQPHLELTRQLTRREKLFLIKYL